MSFTTNDPVLVIGAGAMGAGIAQVAAAAGHRVLLYDLRGKVAEAAVTDIGRALNRLVESGKLSPERRQTTLANLTPIDTLDQLDGAGLVVEAVKEDLGVKQALFAEVEPRLAATAVMASNTSSLSITAIASVLRRPERFAGLHFFNPAPVMPLVEVVAGLATDPAVTNALREVARAWGKIPVVTKSTPGFIVNRIARPFYGEALRVLQEGGADPATLDAVMRESAGFRMGPFELMDLIGHDVNFAVSCAVHAAFFGDPRFTPSLIQQELVAAGRLGRKSGRGFYDYTPGAEAPQATQLPAGHAPTSVLIEGALGPADALSGLAQAAGMAVSRTPGAGLIRLDGATLALTDGRSATMRAAQDGIADLVLFDLALDYAVAARINLAKSDQASAAALSKGAGFFQALGKVVSPLADIPGMIGARTICMLANEAADAINQGVAHAADIDLAMLKGVNYPRGPLAWADQLGAARVLTLIENLAGAYGEDRYRPSLLLRHVAARGGRLLEVFQ